MSRCPICYDRAVRWAVYQSVKAEKSFSWVEWAQNAEVSFAETYFSTRALLALHMVAGHGWVPRGTWSRCAEGAR